jgi:hypothetical protein
MRMRMGTTVGLAMLVAALAGCAQTSSREGTAVAVSDSATTAPTASPDGEVHSKADAQARADADLAAVHLPAGATARSTAPSPQLTSPPETSDVTTLLDAFRWWTVPGTVKNVASFVESHAPYGLSMGGSSSGSDAVSAVMFRKPIDGHDNGHDEIDVSLVQTGSSVAVRVDAQVIWLTPKSLYDTIAPTDGPATLTYTGGGGQPKRTVTLTGGQLSRLATAIDAAELLPPGPPWSCPMDNGEHAVLTLRPGTQTRAFDIQLMGCRFITVTVDGEPGDTLTMSDGPQALVREYVGAQLSPSTAPSDAGGLPGPASASR